jgi:hypothetical protein
MHLARPGTCLAAPGKKASRTLRQACLQTGGVPTERPRAAHWKRAETGLLVSFSFEGFLNIDDVNDSSGGSCDYVSEGALENLAEGAEGGRLALPLKPPGARSG